MTATDDRYLPKAPLTFTSLSHPLPAVSAAQWLAPVGFHTSPVPTTKSLELKPQVENDVEC